MLTTDFDYILPPERIAQHSVDPRDHSKLMLLDREQKKIAHHRFIDIVDYFQEGDVLVWNNSKVFKARLTVLFLKKNDVDEWEVLRKGEIFLLREVDENGRWHVLAKPARRLVPGMRIVVLDHQLTTEQDSSWASDISARTPFQADVLQKEIDGTLVLRFFTETDGFLSSEDVRRSANQYGGIPIPPYVKDEPHQLESYQNVYAKHEGSVAAPTAGFHFTPRVIDALKAKGVRIVEITLHVGLGTFLPVKTERVDQHQLHSEWVEVSKETADSVNEAKREGRRVIAVGTTSVRTLEGIAAEIGKTMIRPTAKDINLFITPGFEFRIVDAMITNFHLPKSTLLMLVAAFTGDRAWMLDCYNTAVEEKYRFYSFGDAMFIM